VRQVGLLAWHVNVKTCTWPRRGALGAIYSLLERLESSGLHGDNTSGRLQRPNGGMPGHSAGTARGQTNMDGRQLKPFLLRKRPAAHVEGRVQKNTLYSMISQEETGYRTELPRGESQRKSEKLSIDRVR
jgi:hypothetical protein